MYVQGLPAWQTILIWARNFQTHGKVGESKQSGGLAAPSGQEQKSFNILQDT